MSNHSVFRARPDKGGVVSSVAMLVILLGNLSFLFLTGAALSGALVPVIILALFIVWSAYMLLIFPTIRYELEDEGLKIKIGPHAWKVPYREIRDVSVTKLKYHPTSTGWKLPGYAVFKIYYVRHGDIRMCAVSLTKDIILITTDGGLYGITPERPEAFSAALKERVWV